MWKVLSKEANSYDYVCDGISFEHHAHLSDLQYMHFANEKRRGEGGGGDGERERERQTERESGGERK